MENIETGTEQIARKIKIVSVNGQRKTIEFDGTSWGQLKVTLELEGFNLKNTKAQHGSSKVTFENENSVIPDGDFTLFILPTKSESGAAVSRGDLYLIIRRFILQNEEVAKRFFNEGCHYTNKTTQALSDLVDSYYKIVDKAPDTEVKITLGESISDLIKSLQNKAGQESVDILVDEMSRLSLDEKFAMLLALILNIRVSVVTDPTSVPQTVERDIEREEIEEAERLEREEKERLKREEFDLEEAELRAAIADTPGTRR